MQYFTIVYVLCILLYNFLKARPYKWPYLLLKKLMGFFFFSCKRLRKFFWKAFYFFFRLYGSFLLWFGFFIFYLEESCFIIVEFCRSFDFLSELCWKNLRIALRETILAFFSLYKECLLKHVSFIYSSSVAFLERPFVYR